MTTQTEKNLLIVLKSVGNGKGLKDFSIVSNTEVNMNHEFDSIEQAKKNIQYWSNELTMRLGEYVKVSGVFGGQVVESNHIHCVKCDNLNNERNSCS